MKIAGCLSDNTTPAAINIREMEQKTSEKSFDYH